MAGHYDVLCPEENGIRFFENVQQKFRLVLEAAESEIERLRKEEALEINDDSSSSPTFI
jgi:hypothetical protein